MLAVGNPPLLPRFRPPIRDLYEAVGLAKSDDAGEAKVFSLF
jgi:hypothetical protein